MKNILQLVVLIAIVIGIVVFSAICEHSIEEIHYLKSFFPKSFTVEEALYASIIELIKIVIIGVPFFLVISSGLIWLIYSRKQSG